MKTVRVAAAIAIYIGVPIVYGELLNSPIGLAIRSLPTRFSMGDIWVTNLAYLACHVALAGTIAVFAASLAHFVFPRRPFAVASTLAVAVFLSEHGTLVINFLSLGLNHFRAKDLAVIVWFMLVVWLTMRAIVSKHRMAPTAGLSG